MAFPHISRIAQCRHEKAIDVVAYPYKTQCKLQTNSKVRQLYNTALIFKVYLTHVNTPFTNYRRPVHRSGFTERAVSFTQRYTSLETCENVHAVCTVKLQVLFCFCFCFFQCCVRVKRLSLIAQLVLRGDTTRIPGWLAGWSTRWVVNPEGTIPLRDATEWVEGPFFGSSESHLCKLISADRCAR